MTYVIVSCLWEENICIASYFLNQEVFLSLSEKQCCRVFLIFPGLSHQDDSGDVLAPASLPDYWDTTLFYDQNGDDEEEEVDVKIVNQSWRLFSKRPYHNYRVIGY